MEAVGVGLALGPILIKVYQTVHKYANEIRHCNAEAADLAFKMDVQMQKTERIYNALFKAPTVSAESLFQKLDRQMQGIVSAIVYKFDEAISLKYRLLCSAYGLTGFELDHAHDSKDVQQQRSNRVRLAWVISGKSRVEKVLKICEYWNDQLWDLLQIQLTGDLPLTQGPWPTVSVPPRSLELLNRTDEIVKLGLRNDIDVARISYQKEAVRHLDWQALGLDIASIDLPPGRRTDTNSAGEEGANIVLGKLDGRRVVLDVKYLSQDAAKDVLPQPDETILSRVRQLAILLNRRRSYEQKARLLDFAGLYRMPKGDAYAYVFKYPNSCFGSPISLQELYSRKAKAAKLPRPALETRLRLATVLAISLFQFHTVGWIHKSFRSSNILFFPDEEDTNSPDVTQPWLVGFEYAREDPGLSEVIRPDIRNDVYRHPDNWGKPTTRFHKIHDIYSLGVVLLEIGLWKSVFQLDEHGFRDKRYYDREEIQQKIRAKARSMLPFYAGTTYTEVVIKCLTGRFEKVGGDGHLEATHSSYHQEIVETLRKISFEASTGQL